MTEEFLYFIWQHQYFSLTSLKTTDGIPVTVLRPGIRNLHSGPDFFNAKVVIGNQLWAGNVEIHVRGKDWNLHKHASDPAFNNVVLHVVYTTAIPILSQAGRNIPTIELADNIHPALLDRYGKLELGNPTLPCIHYIQKINPLYIKKMMEKALFSRLEMKEKELTALVDFHGGNWEQATYEWIATAFGFKVNAIPFQLLARSLPVTLINRYKTNTILVEALLFGQAGLLHDHTGDGYYQALKKEYVYLKQKHQLVSLMPGTWQTARMRPANFPTLRISQFGDLLKKPGGLLATILETSDPSAFIAFFSCKASEYWNTHYVFCKTSLHSEKHIGMHSIYKILVNSVATLLFAYGTKNHRPVLVDRALQLLNLLPQENNSLTRRFTGLGFANQHAADSQGMMQLLKEWCIPKKCLTCDIGKHVLKNSIA